MILNTQKCIVGAKPDWSKAVIEVNAKRVVDGVTLRGQVSIPITELAESRQQTIGAGMAEIIGLKAGWLAVHTLIVRRDVYDVVRGGTAEEDVLKVADNFDLCIQVVDAETKKLRGCINLKTKDNPKLHAAALCLEELENQEPNEG